MTVSLYAAVVDDDFDGAYLFVSPNPVVTVDDVPPHLRPDVLWGSSCVIYHVPGNPQLHYPVTGTAPELDDPE